MRVCVSKASRIETRPKKISRVLGTRTVGDPGSQAEGSFGGSLRARPSQKSFQGNRELRSPKSQYRSQSYLELSTRAAYGGLAPG